MFLFSAPKCPECGTKCVLTDDGLFEEFVCPACYRKNKERRKIKQLEQRIRELEKKTP